MIDLPERFSVLLELQDKYTCDDYLQQHYVSGSTEEGIKFTTESTPSSRSPSKQPNIDEELRIKICDWCYKVVDHYNMNRQTVSVAISYFDRVLSTFAVNKKTAQLIGMTSLYLAVKLYEERKLNITSLIELSQGHFKESDIATMEKEMIRALDFQVHPPTPQEVIYHLLLLLPPKLVRPTTKHFINDRALYLVELSSLDYFFAIRKPSSIALASMLVIMQPVRADEHSHGSQSSGVPSQVLIGFLRNLRRVTSLDPMDVEVTLCLQRLREMYHDSGYSGVSDVPMSPGASGSGEDGAEHRVDATSPVCVSGIIDPVVAPATATVVVVQRDRRDERDRGIKKANNVMLP